jgi:tripeptide aminopeptidase
MSYKYTVAERFLRYVQIDTQSDPVSESYPSTEKQKNLSTLLVKELKEIGIKDVELDEYGYVYARVPSNSAKKNIPAIFFCAHVDTAPDCSGKDVKPIVHKNYGGEVLTLPDDPNQRFGPEEYPNLKKKIGHDIITASGLTLLGSDDKSGVAEIMDAAYQLVNNPSIIHGDVYLLFTPDEEVGRGTDKINMDKLPAAFGYTLDGGEVGSFENENFSANSFHIKINGVAAHPGYAKGKMEHACKIASAIICKLPKDTLSPESTDKKAGFVHPNKIQGGLESAQIDFIIRDFKTANLSKHEQMLKDISHEVLNEFPNSSVIFESKKQYRNMKDILDENPHITEYALEALNRLGLSAQAGSIRGGTDGAMLSHKGLPCPNLFAGEQAIHSKHEWVSIQDMQLAVDTIVEICRITEERAS